MKYLKLSGVALALLTLGLTTTSSFAQTLPDISIALGGSYPLHLAVTLLSVNTELTTIGGSGELHGVGLLLLFLTEQLTSLGSFDALFTSVLNPAENQRCFSEVGTTADGTGLMLTLGTFHIVLKLNGSLAILYLVQPLKVVCGTVMIHIRGSILSPINTQGTEGTEYSSLMSRIASGSPGVPEWTEYLDDGGTIVSAKLESDFGTGYVTSAENVGEDVEATVSEGKMFVIKPR
jgi:hypothetical protein